MSKPLGAIHYGYATLDNGLRIVHLQRKSVAEYLGVAVRAGSADDPAGKEGLAHFVEHTIFKGTHRRRSHHIINRMERVGGELNAYTTKEETMVYTVYPTGHIRRAADLLADLVLQSVFPTHELEKEREVVADEIDSYLDTPADAVYDDFEDRIYAGTPLGHNILGTKAALRTFSSEDCQRFLSDNYRSQNMTVFYLGPQSLGRVTRVIGEYFDGVPSGPKAVVPAMAAPVATPFAIKRDDAGSHQAHTVIGAPIPALDSPLRHRFSLLNNILGGPGMNSRLNIALRERRGLVYTIDSTLSLYSTTGLYSVYYGCNPEDNERCRDLVFSELDKLGKAPLTDRALAMAQRQYVGQLTVATASNEQMILSAARASLFHGRAAEPLQTIGIINSITPDELQESARMIAPGLCSTLTLS